MPALREPRRAGAAILAAAVAWLLAPAPVAAAEPVRLGVRSDAAPFAFRAPGAAGYAGYIVELCRAIVERMGREPVMVEVAARARFQPEASYDVLCDPATVTVERARLGVFSPPVFVSGISFVFSARNDAELYRRWVEWGEDESEKNGSASAAEAAAGLPDCAAVDAGGRAVQARVGALAATTAADFVERVAVQGGDEVPGLGGHTCLAEVDSHDDGFDALCDGELSYYFGDRDILAAQLTRRRAAGRECGLVLSRRFLTVEPYALFLRSDDAGFISDFMVAFYEVFGAEEGGPRELFATYFPDRRPSELVEAIIFLNAAAAR